MVATKKTTAERLSQVQSALVCGKGQRNEFANFNFRSCEDILKAVKPLLLGGELLLLRDELVEMCGHVYIKSTASFNVPGGEVIEVSAFAREPDAKKGMDSAQMTGLTSSYARKYAANGLLLTDDGIDSDSLKPEPDPEKEQKGSSVPGLTRIKGITQVTKPYAEGHKDFGKSWTKYTVIDGNGTKYSTFTKKLATAAKKAKDEGLEVNIGFKVDGQFKNLTFIDIQSPESEDGPGEVSEEFDEQGNPA